VAKNAIGALRRARSANGWTGQTGRFWKNVRVAKHTPRLCRRERRTYDMEDEELIHGQGCNRYTQKGKKCDWMVQTQWCILEEHEEHLWLCRRQVHSNSQLENK